MSNLTRKYVYSSIVYSCPKLCSWFTFAVVVVVVVVVVVAFITQQTERRYSSKLYDMRDRLDQANSTTRSMQNYVAFLKSSYANVFDELESPR